jgi:hypothetical protein
MNESVATAGTAQRLLWAFERRRGNASGALNDPVVVRLRRALQLPALESALQLLVERHDALRTRMLWQPPRLMRSLSADWGPRLAVVDLRRHAAPLQELESQLGAELARDIASTDWPLRATLWQLAADDHVLCLNIHHNATDFSSGDVLRSDLALLYRRHCGESVELPSQRGWPYWDWVDWHSRQLEEPNRSRLIEYWTSQLDGATEPSFPEAKTQPTVAHGLTGYESSRFGDGVFEALLELAQRERTSPFGLLLAVFYVALARRTKQTDLMVTSLLSERIRPELSSTVGCLVTLVPLRTTLQLTDSFRDVVRATRRTLFGAIEHQAMPFQLLPAAVHRNARIRIEAVALQLMGDRAAFPAPFEPLDWRPDFGGGRTFDLEVVIQPIWGIPHVNVLYGTHRFDKTLIQRLVADIHDIAARVIAEPAVELAALLA